jgi:chromosome segregation ATPase
MKCRNLLKHKHLAITFVAVTAFAVGCKPSADNPATDPPQTTAQQFDKVKKETKEAAQDMKDYAYAQKAEFVAKMQGQLDEINRDLDQLAAKVDKSSDAAKAEAKPKLQTLRDQAAKLNTQLDGAKNATESTWSDVKAGFKKGYSELKDGFNQARQWVSDKIAP